MAENVNKTEIVPVVGVVKRCEMCPGIIGDGDHEDDKCAVYQKREAIVVKINGGIMVRK